MSKINVIRCGSSGCVFIMEDGNELTLRTDHASPAHAGTPMTVAEYLAFVEQLRDPASNFSALYDRLKMTDEERARVRRRVLDGLV